MSPAGRRGWLDQYAATGGPLLLGKSNTASKTTNLTTTGNGAALKLKSKKGKAPLKVSNDTKIKKLNADLVDGLDSDALETKGFVYTLSSPVVTEDFVNFQLPGLPSGRYHASFTIAAGVNGSPTFFGCFIVTGAGLGIIAPVVGMGVNSGGPIWIASGSGYVDTTTATYRGGLPAQRWYRHSHPRGTQLPRAGHLHPGRRRDREQQQRGRLDGTPQPRHPLIHDTPVRTNV